MTGQLPRTTFRTNESKQLPSSQLPSVNSSYLSFFPPQIIPQLVSCSQNTLCTADCSENQLMTLCNLINCLEFICTLTLSKHIVRHFSSSAFLSIRLVCHANSCPPKGCYQSPQFSSSPTTLGQALLMLINTLKKSAYSYFAYALFWCGRGAAVAKV